MKKLFILFLFLSSLAQADNIEQVIKEEISTNLSESIDINIKEDDYFAYLNKQEDVELRDIKIDDNNFTASFLVSNPEFEEIINISGNFTKSMTNSDLDEIEKSLIDYKPKKIKIQTASYKASKKEAYVAKGEIISVIYQSDNLKLKTVGKALDKGTINEKIRVQNPESNKIIYATIIGNNLVKVLDEEKF
jgi:hypothetical protein